MKQKKCLAFALALLIMVTVNAQYKPNWKSLDKRPVPNWYQNAKFGIFIHWGVYSVPAFAPVGKYAEWYQHMLRYNPDGPVAKFQKEVYGNQSYYDLAKYFKAELFDPTAWANLIQKSGAKYVVLTSKHHDGFCLWPSKIGDRDWGFPWNSTEIGPKKDLVGEFFAAIRKTDVVPGLYYSLFEWYNPLFLKNRKEFAVRHTIPQMKDLINTYKPEVLWTDGDWDLKDTAWHSMQFLAWLYNDSPVKNSIVTYDRWGAGDKFHHGGVYTPEYQPGVDLKGHYFEESQGMGYSYGYNRAENIEDYSTAQSLILELIDIVSRGGNFLLDIGPKADGTIPPIMQERLLEIGKWLSVNGDAIYGTHPWTVPCQWSRGNRDYKQKKRGSILLSQTIDVAPGYAAKEIFFTSKENNLFCILPKYPDDNKIVVKDISLEKNATVTFLATGEQLSWKKQKDGILVTLPAYDPNKIKVTDAYVLKISDVRM